MKSDTWLGNSQVLGDCQHTVWHLCFVNLPTVSPDTCLLLSRLVHSPVGFQKGLLQPPYYWCAAKHTMYMWAVSVCSVLLLLRCRACRFI